MMITQDELRDKLDYDADTGHLIWSKNAYHRVRGKVAGKIHYTRGYRQIKLNEKMYLAHRLVWLYHNGVMPENEIDHINNIRDDNRIENLREVTHAENQQNRIDTKRNGVMWKDNPVRLERMRERYHRKKAQDQQRQLKKIKEV